MSAQRFTVVGGDESPADDVAVETRPLSDRDVAVDVAVDLDLERIEDRDVDLADAVDLDDLDVDADAESSDEDDPNGDRELVPASPVLPTSHPRVSEAVRYLLDRYEMTAAKEFPSAIAVVSALRKEGVTTVSQSLAEVLSVDFGYTVCWVDVSWAQGAPLPQRGLRRRRDRPRRGSRSPGILDVLGGDAVLEDVMNTSVETQVVHLGAGSTSLPLREVTRSIELQDLFDELKSRFEILVFDSAPVAENSSALSLIQQAEAYVFVTQHGATTTQHVSEAVRMLDPLPAMGAVLNSFRNRTPAALRRFFPAER